MDVRRIRAISRGGQAGHAQKYLWLSGAILLAMGALGASGWEEYVAYGLIVLSGLLPMLLWIRIGMRGVPIMPAVGLMHILYYALPIALKNPDISSFDSVEILRSAATVSLFLIAATAAWKMRLIKMRPQMKSGGARETPRYFGLNGFIAISMVLGIMFQVSVIGGWLTWAGSVFGLLRAVMMTAAVVGCYLLGAGRGRGTIRGTFWLLALLAFGALVALVWSSLFLVGGVIYLAAAVLGYAIESKRLPWRALLPLLLLTAILHAGKAEMRDRYWYPGTNYGGVNSVLQVPGLEWEWMGTGIKAIATGRYGQSLVDRASLLRMLLIAQQKTPSQVGYLYGRTYMLLPQMLVPRFLTSGKIASQAAMDLLNVRYGILSSQGVTATAIGWGPIAEGYANFGYSGVIIVGLILGLIMGEFSRRSVGANAMSLRMLLAIVAIMTMINLEADLSYLLVNLFQASMAAFILFSGYRWLVGGRKVPPSARVGPASGDRGGRPVTAAPK